MERDQHKNKQTKWSKQVVFWFYSKSPKVGKEKKANQYLIEYFL